MVRKVLDDLRMFLEDGDGLYIVAIDDLYYDLACVVSPLLVYAPRSHSLARHSQPFLVWRQSKITNR